MIVHKKNSLLVVSSLLLLVGTATCLQSEEIAWQSDVGKARQMAREQGKPLLVHFWSESCGPCKKLDRYVFPHPDVARVVNGVVPVKVNTRQQRKVAQQFGIKRIPTDVLIAPDGREVWRGISPSTVNAYIGMVNRAVHLQQTASDRTGLSGLAAAARHRSQQSVGHQTGFVGQTGYAPKRGPASAPRQVANLQNSLSDNPYASNPSDSSPPNQGREQLSRNDLASGGGSFQVGGGAFQPGGGAFRRPQASSPPQSPPQQQPAPAPTDAGNNSAVRRPRSDQPRPTENPHFARAPRRPAPRPQTPPTKPARPRTQQAAAKPKFALAGYCPVSLLEERRWSKGDPRWGVVHRGQTYVFASEAKAKKFWAEPDAYSPMLSGFDPVKFAEDQEWVPGKRQFGVFYKDQRSGKTAVVLFADEAALQRFWQSPEAYSGRVQQAMQYNGPVQRR